ncbi:MAG TPA: ABC-F family ATP-binding cassette domain-containing protein [Vicinamibacterales bacterium]|nr:ABC-F family ATP-binding cassette domain-containing protein [Vicinamibacterales bacterium]
MIQIASLTKSFGDRVLFDNVTWQISDGERVGLTGPNGSGKTTLLKILAGLDEPDSGQIVTPADLTVGYLPQDGIAHAGRTVHEEAMLAFAPLLAIKAEMQALEDRLGHPDVPDAEHEQMLVRYSDLQDRFRLSDGYNVDLRIATVLQGLGFGQADFDRPTETFSGGWQMRLALAKLLLARPNLLLLDEPTNHLDLEARNWLEGYLHDYPHAVILVSHDRYFLDTVVTRVAQVYLRQLNDYPGNYSHYLEESQARLDRIREAKRQQDEEIERMKMFIGRFRYQATKAAQVQSRIKMLEKIVRIEVPPERKRVHFSFPSSVKSGRTVFELEHVDKVYGDNAVFRQATLHVERGDRIALVGPNGSGKSTLMRMLAGVEAPDRGARREGHQVVMQYFAQDEAVRLDPGLTVHETLQSGSPMQMVPAIRNILGGFLFSGDDVYKRVEVLSGGERTRLAVARMLLRPSNTLLLDEPTNHLDLDSKDVLLDALEDYGGTLVFVSHDRYFVEKLANRIVEVGAGEVHSYPGRYEEFLWSKARGQRGAVQAAAGGPGSNGGSAGGGRTRARAASGSPAGPDGQGQGSSKAEAAAGREARRQTQIEACRRDRAAKALRSRVAELEEAIATREAEIKGLEARMASDGFYENRDAVQPVIDRHQVLMWEVGDLMHQWEELQHSLDGAQRDAHS